MVYRRQAVSDLITSTEESNITLTKVFANAIWPEYGPFLSNTQELSDDVLATDSRILQLNDEMANQLADSPVAKVKVFDLQGRTVFSTDTAQIGDDKSESSGFLSAMSRQVVSQLGHRDTFKAVQGNLSDRHLLSSYIPIQSVTTDQEIVGVF
ncbi:MAG: hybrid sensor histidine kinase/response regulator, partial [Cyanobacteria bacterium J06649_5]